VKAEQADQVTQSLKLNINLLYFTYICTVMYTGLMTFVHIILWCDQHHNYPSRAPTWNATW